MNFLAVGFCSLLSRSYTSGVFRTVRHCSKMPFYAVARGITPGIYENWSDCQAQIAGYSGARYKKFATKTEAEEFVKEHAAHNPLVDRRATEDKSAKKDDTKDSEPAAAGNSQDGTISPTLLDMKRGMKKLQKELADLRTKFDLYVHEKYNLESKNSQTRSLHTSSSTAEKRKHSDSDDEKEEETEDGSAKKKIATDDKTKFSTDADGFLIVYTDGACEFNGKHGARAGVGVYFGPNHAMNVSEPVKGRATNNMAEIQAATYAVELAQASGFKKVSVHTDSQFMINCMTSWLKGWKKKNWVKSDGEPVKNKDELIALDKACDGMAVKWIYVKGHDGHEGNEEADRLARQGAKLYKPPPEDD